MARSKSKVDLLGNTGAAITERTRAVSAAFKSRAEQAAADGGDERIKVADMSKTTVRMHPDTEAIIDEAYALYLESVDVVKDGKVVRTKKRRVSKQKFMAWLFEVGLSFLGHMDQEKVMAQYERIPD